MFEFFKQLTDPESIIKYGGLSLLLFVIFAETGLFIGFFLPGDNLVFIAGLLCATHPELLHVNFVILLTSMIAAATLGNVFGYWFGLKTGSKLFKKEDTLLFKKSHLELTQKYYTKHGGKTLILGRFLPIIRTFAPILAGVIKISFPKFMLYNIIGAIAWIGSITSVGYYLGQKFPEVENYLGYIFGALIILTALPILRIYFLSKRNKK